MTAHAVAGRRVLVTRAREDAGRWAARLERLGAAPVLLPCLVREVIDDEGTRRRIRDALAGASWLVVSSRSGVEAVADLLDAPLPDEVRVAAVGPATAAAARTRFGRADLVARETTSTGLGRELAGTLAPPSRIVVAGAEGGRGDAERALAAAGHAVTRADVYRTVPVAPAPRKRDLRAEGVDVVLLASPSAVTGLVNGAVVPDEAQVITIGPTTSAAAAHAGLRVSAEARRPGLSGMLEVLT